ncbi:hypothetical protein [Micromonospora sp. NPDC126480]|uniref:hypothetical protein n=1 Tax=Micromonospora sp. NPDC126480 TaxID=3155312 RepID=UPI0033230B9A
MFQSTATLPARVAPVASRPAKNSSSDLRRKPYAPSRTRIDAGPGPAALNRRE